MSDTTQPPKSIRDLTEELRLLKQALAGLGARIDRLEVTIGRLVRESEK